MLNPNALLANLSEEQIDVMLPQEMHILRGGTGCHRRCSRSRSWSHSRSWSYSHSRSNYHHSRGGRGHRRRKGC